VKASTTKARAYFSRLPHIEKQGQGFFLVPVFFRLVSKLSKANKIKQLY